MKSNYDLIKNSKQESLNNNFQIPKSMLDNSSTQETCCCVSGQVLTDNAKALLVQWHSVTSQKT